MLTDPPQPDHLQIVTRYSPASDVARIGGDWYDAFLQQSRGPGGHDVVVVVGDVVGHDVEAAAAMGQVRGLLRGIAVHSGYAPAAVLSGVDEVMESLRLETTATAVVARLEHHPRPGAEVGEEVVLRWAHAGHPPALLVTPDGDSHAARRRGRQRPPARPRPRTPGAPSRSRSSSPAPPWSSTPTDSSSGATATSRRASRPSPRSLRELAPATRDLDELCDQLLDRMIGEQPRGRRRAPGGAVDPGPRCLKSPLLGWTGVYLVQSRVRTLC